MSTAPRTVSTAVSQRLRPYPARHDLGLGSRGRGKTTCLCSCLPRFFRRGGRAPAACAERVFRNAFLTSLPARPVPGPSVRPPVLLRPHLVRGWGGEFRISLSRYNGTAMLRASGECLERGAWPGVWNDSGMRAAPARPLRSRGGSSMRGLLRQRLTFQCACRIAAPEGAYRFLRLPLPPRSPFSGQPPSIIRPLRVPIVHPSLCSRPVPTRSCQGSPHDCLAVRTARGAEARRTFHRATLSSLLHVHIFS